MRGVPLAVFTLDGGTLATSANLSSARDIVMTGAGTIATAGGTTFTFNGLLSGSYTGSGGTLEIETALGGDASPADRLVVTGRTAGATQVNVINQGGLGTQTVEGIKIVDVTGTSAGIFTLNGDYDFHGSPAVIAGAYGYRLFQGGVSTPTDGDWYLRSAMLVAPNGPQVSRRRFK